MVATLLRVLGLLPLLQLIRQRSHLGEASQEDIRLLTHPTECLASGVGMSLREVHHSS